MLLKANGNTFEMSVHQAEGRRGVWLVSLCAVNGESTDRNTYAVRGNERRARASARAFASQAYYDNQLGWCA